MFEDYPIFDPTQANKMDAPQKLNAQHFTGFWSYSFIFLLLSDAV